MFIDTHCHLDFDDYDADREDVITRAKSASVDCIVNIGSSLEASRDSVELAKKHDFIFASLGVHPHDAQEVDEATFATLRELARDEKVVAIGEVGLDYYKDLSPKEVQRKVFPQFIQLARELKLPLILHDREAHRDLLEILKQEAEKPVNGVVHCFSGSAEFAKQLLDLGLYISFTCNLTFKNAVRLREIAKTVPLQRLLLETDSPFLAPQPVRGQRNEPAYIRFLAEELASLKNSTLEDVARITSSNARALFKKLS